MVNLVAPLVGAWIEIFTPPPIPLSYFVAPLVGAWIEIWNRVVKALSSNVAPLWERGLKLRVVLLSVLRIQVGDMLDECVERFPF